MHKSKKEEITTVIEQELMRTDVYFANKLVRIKGAGGDVDAIEIRGKAHYEGTAGFKGDFLCWFSNDERAFLLKAKIKIFLGSITIMLKENE
ncbi:hypothetical protein ISS37_09135 [candidate division KSB1 bacterium]|nr:hypothetical protein [candidate division KSB1 bacterium]